MMDKKWCSSWMMVVSLVLGIVGLAFILVSIFDSDASTTILMTGMLFIVAGNLFNMIRLQQNKKNREE